ncbi:Outer membrane receptor proteins, mostly Fe transport [Chryseobacterium piscicola]|uniref:Outer membrane receptor proteins, mostly Fe transport n=1 Tax=Chryseobacterium piscicola TaxID=551459 RepID=A0A1N7ML05_9FLAO|nr:TonB-dependent receptor [Chryseobacterium piscicola]PQA90280.1 TonB-dependent receptor [Chryseobacterium piscicola]SIS86678.1 Outer membrane receptor proteins, mostly Fe transport [Chryseobacterium piscicola]
MKKTSILLLTGIATFYFNNTYAQETVQDSTKTRSIDQVVITGNSRPKPKIESSTAISTFTAKEIQKQNPISAAALLQKVPGFAVETSGGEVGNNLFARGIPSAGAYEFTQVQEDGLPVFEDGALQFANADNFFRVDNSVSRLEALRGGSGSIFATNSPGGLINFITKEGGNDFKGTAKLETSTYGLMRTDVNLGGALIQDKLFFNVGGFYRTDDGIRKTDFKANQGGQIRMNLKYVFDKGYAKVYYKKLDDRNTFFLPIPLTQNGNDLKEFNGFNANYGTYSYRSISQLNIPQAGGGFFKRNLEDGIHPKVDVLGAEFKYDLGDNLSVTNKTRYTNINLNYTGIFPAGGPKTAKNFANTNGGITGNNFQYSLVSSGQVVNPAYVQELGFWAIDKKMNNFVNDLQFNYKFNKGNITAGFYKSNWKSNQYWNWSNVLATATDKPELLNLVDTSLTPNSIGYSKTYNGVTAMSFLLRESQVQGSLNDVYTNLDYNITDNLSLNAGIRYSRDFYKGYSVNTTKGNLNNSGLTTDGTHSFATTTADDNMSVLGNKYSYWKYDIDKVSYTLAANYKINKNNAVYGRFSHGFRSPNEEAYYNYFTTANPDQPLKPVTTNQIEVGYKYYTRNFDIGVIPFYSTLKNLSFTDVFSNGSSENTFADTENYGVEVEGFARFFNNLVEVSFNGTIQNPKYTGLSGSSLLEGNTVRRMPKLYFTISPAVNITKEWRTYVSYNYYGKRFQDQLNTQTLPAFGELGAGTSYQLGKLRFAVDGTNIFNTIGITEGDPRAGSPSGDGTIMARPIMGAAVRASITLDF